MSTKFKCVVDISLFMTYNALQIQINKFGNSAGQDTR